MFMLSVAGAMYYDATACQGAIVRALAIKPYFHRERFARNRPGVHVGARRGRAV
jgi:hypothetical protein